MSSTDDAQDDVLARFHEITSGLDAEVFGDVSVDRRRRQPPTVQVLTVRVDLHHSTPPIWRRLELRSDLSLEDLHAVLQTAFDWAGYHLWRFAAGGEPFEEGAQQFVCESDVEEGEDPDGVPAGEVRLGELLQRAGDTLEYLYDYGDGWDLGIVVEAVREAEAGDAPARATGGSRAAPPEDCGGLRDEEDLKTLLEDPAFFDVAALGLELWSGMTMLTGPEDDVVPALLVEPLTLVGRARAGQDLMDRALLLGAPLALLPDSAVESALRALTWFLERADAEGGIPLTGAGYLRPADVEAASAVLPQMADWIGMNKGEVHAVPLQMFRTSLQRAGILRKRKGALLLTRRARAYYRAGNVRELFLDSLVLSRYETEELAQVVLLTYVATTKPGLPLPMEEIARVLTAIIGPSELGPGRTGAILDLPAWHLLANTGTVTSRLSERGFCFSPEATSLAREALTR
ncbi:plasmid pRiA4b ORF-3 family protein [Brachybacterium paraconglomeratum]|uniref:plasmid pRiA4b ORF-3 family protein n=1 Tax=Brachybacterium paraconglomeratum TaxID=173362 RepID=UPI0024922016|nr:plasmid pRiA4b ORF-3 family protein [Brachybacterium paraconglomeratum]